MTATKTRKRRRTRTPASDWQLPLLTDLGFRPSQQKLLVIIASIAGVLVLAGGLTAVVATLGGGVAPERQATAAALDPGTSLPEVFHGWASPKGLEVLADRSKDGKPLTEKEVFGAKTLTGEKKLTLKLTESKLDGDCAAALWGSELLDQVSDAGCTQAARGAYTSSDGRYLGQYTLLNLRDVKAAGELVESLKTLYRGGWTRQLVTFPEGGHTEAGAYALGHYVGLVWVARADGADPTPKDDFVSLTLTLRGAEKAIYRRAVAITGPTS